MTENKGLISALETKEEAEFLTVLKEKALADAKAGNFTDALLTAQQIENKSQLVETLRAIASIAASDKMPIIERREFLKLPVAERNALLARQAAIVAEHFLPGSEEMEWVEEYIEDDDWDDE